MRLCLVTVCTSNLALRQTLCEPDLAYMLVFVSIYIQVARRNVASQQYGGVANNVTDTIKQLLHI